MPQGLLWWLPVLLRFGGGNVIASRIRNVGRRGRDDGRDDGDRRRDRHGRERWGELRVDWWDDFAHAGPDQREALLRQAPPDAAPAAKKRRRRKRKPAGETPAAADAAVVDPS